MIAGILLFLTAPIQYLPSAVLGAVIVFAAAKLIDPEQWRSLARSARAEVVIAAVTATFVVTIGVLQAIIVAVVLSVADVIRRAARPADAVLGWSADADRHVILDASFISDIDASAEVALRETIGGRRERNIELHIARASAEIRLRLDEVGLADAIGADHFHGTVTAAVDACGQSSETTP